MGGPRALRTRGVPPDAEELSAWLQKIPLWKRSGIHTWDVYDDPHSTATRCSAGSANGNNLRILPKRSTFPDDVEVSSEGEPPREPAPRPASPKETMDTHQWLSKLAGRKRKAAGQSESAAASPGVEALPQRCQQKARSSADKTRTKRAKDPFSAPVSTLSLPPYVVDLSDRSALERFARQVAETKEVCFALLCVTRPVGDEATKAAWQQAPQYFTSTSPVTKEQKSVLRCAVGTASLKSIDPDGLVVGAGLTLLGQPKGEGKGVVFFLPLVDDAKHYRCQVPLVDRVHFLQELLCGREVVAQCFDFQGVLRRLYRDCEGFSFPVNTRSRTLCFKLASWLLEPALVHDKVIDAFSLAKVCHFYQIPQQAEAKPEDPYSALSRDLKLVTSLSGKLFGAMKRQHFTQMLQIEVQISGILAGMESAGILFNLEELNVHEQGIRRQLEVLEAAVTKYAGEAFNVRSPLQLCQILYDKMDAEKYTKSDKRSTDEKTLQVLGRCESQSLRMIALAVLDYRRLAQILSKWVDADWLVRAKLEQRDATILRIKSNWNQTSTATGRLSASNPNLQAVTKYTIDGSGDGTASNVINIRDAFVSNLGSVLLSIDYSQIEIRLLAHLSEDSKLCEILTSTFKEKADVFARIADTWLAKARPLTQDKQSGREQAKRVAYSIIYGTSSYGLGKQLGVDIDTAETLKTSFLSFFSTVHAHGESVKKFAAKEGYVETMFKRRRYLPGICSEHRHEREAAERKAVNTGVQGSAADLIKCAMVKVSLWNENEGRKRGAQPVKLIAQIHDELLFEVPPETDLRWASLEIEKIMCGVFTLRVPLSVSMQSGTKWGSLKNLPSLTRL